MTPDFGTVKNLFKMASNGEVIYMKEFREIIHARNFRVQPQATMGSRLVD